MNWTDLATWGKCLSDCEHVEGFAAEEKRVPLRSCGHRSLVAYPSVSEPWARCLPVITVTNKVCIAAEELGRRLPGSLGDMNGGCADLSPQEPGDFMEETWPRSFPSTPLRGATGGCRKRVRWPCFPSATWIRSRSRCASRQLVCAKLRRLWLGERLLLGGTNVKTLLRKKTRRQDKKTW